MLVNLTPHDIFVHYGAGDTRRIVASATPARIEYAFQSKQTEVDGVTLKIILGSTVVGLPEKKESTTYIVSSLVKAYCKDRLDVVCPGDLVKEEGGRVIGCKTFMR